MWGIGETDFISAYSSMIRGLVAGKSVWSVILVRAGVGVEGGVTNSRYSPPGLSSRKSAWKAVLSHIALTTFMGEE
jgi:hypothetical protein